MENGLLKTCDPCIATLYSKKTNLNIQAGYQTLVCDYTRLKIKNYGLISPCPKWFGIKLMIKRKIQ